MEIVIISTMEASLNRKLKRRGSIASVNISTAFVICCIPWTCSLDTPSRTSLRFQKQAFWHGQTEHSILLGRLWFVQLSTQQHEPSKWCKLLKHLWCRKGKEELTACSLDTTVKKEQFKYFIFNSIKTIIDTSEICVQTLKDVFTDFTFCAIFLKVVVSSGCMKSVFRLLKCSSD